PSALRHAFVDERRLLAGAIALWSPFLASSADATEVLDQAAEIAERLDLIRDAALEAETAGSPVQVAELNAEIGRFNVAVEALVSELRRQVAATDRLAQAPVIPGR